MSFLANPLIWLSWALGCAYISIGAYIAGWFNRRIAPPDSGVAPILQLLTYFAALGYIVGAGVVSGHLIHSRFFLGNTDDYVLAFAVGCACGIPAPWRWVVGPQVRAQLSRSNADRTASPDHE
jgi:hypothetical protein